MGHKEFTECKAEKGEEGARRNIAGVKSLRSSYTGLYSQTFRVEATLVSSRVLSQGGHMVDGPFTKSQLTRMRLTSRSYTEQICSRNPRTSGGMKPSSFTVWAAYQTLGTLRVLSQLRY